MEGKSQSRDPGKAVQNHRDVHTLYLTDIFVHLLCQMLGKNG